MGLTTVVSMYSGCRSDGDGIMIIAQSYQLVQTGLIKVIQFVYSDQTTVTRGYSLDVTILRRFFKCGRKSYPVVLILAASYQRHNNAIHSNVYDNHV